MFVSDHSASEVLYFFGGIQSIPTESILMPVKMTKVDKRHYELPAKMKAEVEDTLERSILGRSFSDDEEEESEEDEDEGVVVGGRGKKRKSVKQTGPGSKKKATPKKKKPLPKKKTTPKT